VPTVLVVDDNAGFRTAARRVLEADGYTVIGEAATGTAALDEAATLSPDLVLLDVQLPDLDGFAVAERLAASHPAPDVVLVSTRSSADYGGRVERAPVRGFVAKSDLSGAELDRVLRP
jgi:two-component system nitrate/nitrite response regulator NarL